MMQYETLSTLKRVLRIIPWRYWSPLGRAFSITAVLGALALFVVLFLPEGDLQWGMILTVSVVIAAVSGGVLLGTLFGVLFSLMPLIVSSFAGAALAPEPGVISAVIVTTVVLCVFLGYIAALTISHGQALAEIRKLQGILPICAHCKRIRDNDGYWNAVEKYISEHSEAVFSHGLCDDCLTEHYPAEAEVIQRMRAERRE